MYPRLFQPLRRSLMIWSDPFEDFARRVRHLERQFFPELHYRPERDLIPKEFRGLFRRHPVVPAGAKFEAHLDVKDFKPEEVTVRVTKDNAVVVEGKHEENSEEKGFISRHFVKTYVFGEDHDLGKIQTQLSSDGVLTITAPRLQEVEGGEEARSVPIMQMGQPAAIKDGSKVEEKKE